jgi:hypothetical protein
VETKKLNAEAKKAQASMKGDHAQL